MDVHQSNTDKKGEFFIEVDGSKVAQMTYSHAGQDKFIIDHTEVDESMRGEGLGYDLVEAAVQHARINNLKIMPLCPFANAVFKKRSDYKDVLY